MYWREQHVQRAIDAFVDADDVASKWPDFIIYQYGVRMRATAWREAMLVALRDAVILFECGGG